jgi:hypothetical protein
MTHHLVIIGTARTLSAQLAAIQKLGILPAGKPINVEGVRT